MRRRTVLALAPTLLSGCTTFGDGSPGRGTSSPTDRQQTATPTDTATATAEPTETTELADTETAEQNESTPTEGPPPELIPAQPKSIPAAEIQNRVESVSCDGLSTLPMVCDDGDDRIELSLSPTVGSLPSDTVEFTMRNRTDERFEWNPYSWRLQKWTDSGWRHVAPARYPIPGNRLEPGASHTYRIDVDNTTFHGIESYTEDTNPKFSGLGPGVYGFSVDGWFESNRDDRFEMGGVFGIAGDGPPVRPTDAVTSVAWEGEDLVVRTDAENPFYVLKVRLVDGGAGVELLADHVRQAAGLRNTLSYAATPGVRTIRYYGDENDAVSYLDGSAIRDAGRYRFRDYVFELYEERL